jgi:hypothetical protein
LGANAQRLAYYRSDVSTTGQPAKMRSLMVSALTNAVNKSARKSNINHRKYYDGTSQSQATLNVIAISLQGEQ